MTRNNEDELKSLVRSELMCAWLQITGQMGWRRRDCEPLHGADRARMRQHGLQIAYIRRLVLGNAYNR